MQKHSGALGIKLGESKFPACERVVLAANDRRFLHCYGMPCVKFERNITKYK